MHAKKTTARVLYINVLVKYRCDVDVAKSYNIEILSCAEKIDLEDLGVRHGKCIDNDIIEQITGYKLEAKKDKNQRQECGCIESMGNIIHVPITVCIATPTLIEIVY